MTLRSLIASSISCIKQIIDKLVINYGELEADISMFQFDTSRTFNYDFRKF